MVVLILRYNAVSGFAMGLYRFVCQMEKYRMETALSPPFWRTAKLDA
jgi:hypothetical protein